jgi:hypothetical protein
MEHIMSAARTKLQAIAQQLMENDERAVGEIFAAMARGERVLTRLDGLDYWDVFGLLGSLFIAFAALQQEEDPAAAEFAMITQFVSLYHANRLQAMATSAGLPINPRLN